VIEIKAVMIALVLGGATVLMALVWRVMYHVLDLISKAWKFMSNGVDAAAEQTETVQLDSETANAIRARSVRMIANLLDTEKKPKN
jgi:hypothetical protein